MRPLLLIPDATACIPPERGCRYGGMRAVASAFALIELLVVLVIITIMLVVALPAFQSFSKQGLKTTVPTIASTIKLARQYAVTKRTDVWMVFPDTRIDYGSPSLREEVTKSLRSYAVLCWDSSLEIFQYVSEWRYLPEGIFFDASATPPRINEFNVFTSVSINSFPFPSTGSSDEFPMASLRFKPDGKVYKMSAGGQWISNADLYMLIYLSAGHRTVDTASGSVINALKLTSPTNVVLRVTLSTGSVDIDYNAE